MALLVDVGCVKKEDRIHFENMFKMYSRELYVFAYRIIGNKAVAEDVVQDFFVKLWLNWHEIEGGDAFRSYCYTSVYHASLNTIRTRSRNAELSEEMMSPVDIESEMERAELRQKLEKAIASLPERCREIFIEIGVMGNSYADTAEKFGLSVNTIKVQMSKAYRILREKLSDEQVLLLFLWGVSVSR